MFVDRMLADKKIVIKMSVDKVPVDKMPWRQVNVATFILLQIKLFDIAYESTLPQ
jgi:hypothetical protein